MKLSKDATRYVCVIVAILVLFVGGAEVAFSRSVAANTQTTLDGNQVLPTQAGVATAGTCGELFYVEQGPDNYPVFLPNGSIEPWFIDPFIFDIFNDGQHAVISGPGFLDVDWGPIGSYDNAKWLAGYAGVEYVTECPALSTNNSIAFTASSSSASGIYLMNSVGGDVRKIALLPKHYLRGAECPTWSPDGSNCNFHGHSSIAGYHEPMKK